MIEGTRDKPIFPTGLTLTLCHEMLAESFVQGRSTDTKSIKGTVDVLLSGKALLPSLQSASKPVPANKPKLLPVSSIPAAQGTKSNSKAAINCRQILNEIRMNNKWSNPVFKLMNEEDPSHVPRLVSTASFLLNLLFFSRNYGTAGSPIHK